MWPSTSMRRCGRPAIRRAAHWWRRGQIVPFREMFEGLTLGLILAVVAIFLLLTAFFQSPRLALVSVSTVPAVLVGVAGVLVGHAHNA